MEGLYKWVACTEGELPASSVEGGHDADKTLYVGRVSMFGDVLPGKIIAEGKVCYVGYGGEEHAATEYEALVGEENVTFEWVSSSQGEVPEGAVEGGVTQDGEKLYVGRATHEETLTIGKIHPSHKTCYIPYGGTENSYEEYEVLVCKPPE